MMKHRPAFVFRSQNAGAITSLDANDEILVAGDRNGSVNFWSQRSRKSTASWQTGAGTVLGTRLINDGRRLFTAGRDSIIEFWDISAGCKLLQQLDLRAELNLMGASTFCPVQTAADGSSIAVPNDKKIQVIPLELSGKSLEFGGSENHRHGSVCSMKFIRESNLLVGGYEDGSVLTFDLRAPGDPTATFERIHKDAVLSIDVLVNGNNGVSCGADNAVCCWSRKNDYDVTDTHLYETSNSKPGANAVAMENNVVTIGCWSGDVVAFNLEQGPEQSVNFNKNVFYMLNHHKQGVNAIHFHRGSLYVGSDDRTISLWFR